MFFITSIVCTSIAALITAFLALYAIKFPRREGLQEWGLFFIILFCIAAGIANWLDHKNDENEKAELKKTINQTKALSQLNYELGQKIERLQEINNSIGNATGVSISENKKLTGKSLSLIEQVKPVIMDNKKLSGQMTNVIDEMRKEQSGYKSLPIISAVPKYYFVDEYNYTQGWNEEDLPYARKYTVRFLLEHYGKYSLNKIEISGRWQTGSMEETTEIEPVIVDLSPNQTLRLGGRYVIGPYTSDAFNPCDFSFTVKIKKKISYKYKCDVYIINDKMEIKEFYTYKNVTYSDYNKMIPLILKDL